MSASASVLIRADEFDKDFEDKVAAEGSYDLRITSAKPKLSQKTERKMFAFGMLIEDPNESYETVFHNVNFPLTTDEPRTQKSMMRDIKRFATLFSIPLEIFVQASELSNDDFIDQIAPELASIVGSTAKCMLVQKPKQDSSGNETGDMRNELRLPKVG
jgi:hypothetical protein